MKNTVLYTIALVAISCNLANKNSTEVDLTNSAIDYRATPVTKNYPDSSTYWINEDYFRQVKLGMDICDCMSKNPFLILHIDSSYENLTLQSSTHHFGLETNAKFKLIRTDTLNNHFITEKAWPLNQEMQIYIDNDNLTVKYDKKQYKFVAQKLKTLDIPSTPKGIFTQSMDIFDQRNRINAESLLAYVISDDDANLISMKELRQLIDSNRVSLGCSDDYGYNSLFIKGDTNRYFHLEFEDGKVSLYEEPNGRSRFEKIDVNKLEKQTLYKN